MNRVGASAPIPCPVSVTMNPPNSITLDAGTLAGWHFDKPTLKRALVAFLQARKEAAVYPSAIRADEEAKALCSLIDAVADEGGMILAGFDNVLWNGPIFAKKYVQEYAKNYAASRLTASA